jgi:histidyl-tRNA synthetase
MENAPQILDRLGAEDAEHFAAVRGLLDEAGVAYTLDGSLVRGLDYYNRTVFEFTCDRLGAQSGLGGGGRYDGLVELLGGPATPAVGWAAGVERILLAMKTRPEPEPIDVFVVTGGDRAAASALVRRLRDAGLAADLDLAERSFKGQMKQADRSGARHAVILEGDGTAKLRDMSSGDQRDVDPGAIAAELGGGISETARP